jgi:FlaA1/EpsC-like NDP-sugar epimerase
MRGFESISQGRTHFNLRGGPRGSACLERDRQQQQTGSPGHRVSRRQFQASRPKNPGYPVLGGREDLEHIVRKHDIKKIIVSFKEKGEEKVKEIRSSCVKTGMEVDVRQMKVVIS